MWEPGHLRDGVVFTLVCAMLALVGVLVPFLFPVYGLLIVVVVALITSRHTAVHALAVTGAAAALTALFLGALDAVMLLLEPALLGILYGLCFKNRVAHHKTLAAGVGVALVLVGFDLVILFRVLGESPYEWLAAGVVLDGQPEVMEQAVRVAATLLPGALIAWALLVAWAAFFLAAAFLQRFGILPGPAPVFHRWRLPWAVVWLAIAGLAATLIGDHWGLGTLALIGKNALFVAAVGFMLAGLILAAYLWRELPHPRWLKILVGVAAVINWPVTLGMLVIAGFLDSWHDCRSCYERKRRDKA